MDGTRDGPVFDMITFLLRSETDYRDPCCIIANGPSIIPLERNWTSRGSSAFDAKALVSTPSLYRNAIGCFT